MSYQKSVDQWGQGQGQLGAGDSGGLQGIVMQIARLFAQMVPAMMGAPGTSAQMARLSGYGSMSELFGGPAGPKARGREMMSLGIMGGMGDVMGGGGSQTGGFGMGIGGADAMMAGMSGIGTGGGQMRPGEAGAMMGIAGQGGFFRGVSDVRAARQQMQDLVRTVTTLHHELNLTVETVMQDLATLRQTGGFTTASGAAGAFRSTLTTATMAGINMDQALQQYIAPAAQQMRVAARIPMQMAYRAAEEGLRTVGGANRAGWITEDQLFNATGMGGAEGSMALTGQIQAGAMRSASNPRMNYMIAAAMDTSTGKLDQDKVRQIMSGQMSVQDITSQAGQNIGRIGGQAAWQQMMPQIRGQFMAETGGMGMLALANTAALAATDDPNLQMAYFQRLSGAQDPMQAQAFRAAISSWGAVQERTQNVQAHIDEQAAQGARMTERMQFADLSNVFGSAVDQVVGKGMEAVDKRLSDMSVAATDLLTGYTEPAAVGAAYTADISRGSAAAFYRGTDRSGRGGAGAFLNVGEYASQGKAVLNEMKNQRDQMGAGSDAYKAMDLAYETERAGFVGRLGGAMTQTSEYWRGDTSAMTMTQGEARAKMGLGDTVSAEEKEYTRTREGRLGMLSMYGQAVAMVGDESKVRRALLTATGRGGGKWEGTAVDMMKDLSEQQMQGVVRELSAMTGQTPTGGEVTNTATAWRNAALAAQNFGKGNFSLGQMDVATGSGAGVNDIILAQRRAIESGKAAVGGFGGGQLGSVGGLTTLFQQNAGVAGTLGEYLRGAGKGLTGGTLGEYLTSAGVGSEMQTRIFGEEYLKTTLGSAGKVVTWLEDTTIAAADASRAEILTAGILGTSASERYKELKTKGGETGRVATALERARQKYVDGGDISAVTDVIHSLTGERSDRKFEEGAMALETTAYGRVAQYREAVKGGLTLQEARAQGLVNEERLRTAVRGEGTDDYLYEKASRGVRLSAGEQKQISDRLRATLDFALVNVSASKQGDPGQPTGPGAGAASSGMAQALSDAMTQVPEIRVRVVNPGDIAAGIYTSPSAEQLESGGAAVRAGVNAVAGWIASI